MSKRWLAGVAILLATATAGCASTAKDIGQAMYDSAARDYCRHGVFEKDRQPCLREIEDRRRKRSDTLALRHALSISGLSARDGSISLNIRKTPSSEYCF